MEGRQGGEIKDAANVFLNTKQPGSITQQWLIQPFEDAKAKKDLALLRPPPSKQHEERARETVSQI